MLRLPLLLGAALLLAAPAPAQTINGTVRVVDADTFDIGLPDNIRLLDVDAPEAGQACRDGARRIACGEMATRAARALFEGRRAVCTVTRRDRFGRWLATCEVDGRDVGAELVARGLALTYRDAPRYAEEEKAAQLLERGVWAYDMDDPAVWRAAQRAARAAENAPRDGGCAIKGNVSDNGRIYHMPGSRSYDRTRISPARGERWFCSEAEARAAGWRPAGG
jgi:endonuclease YncB( thermonuclease family)